MKSPPTAPHPVLDRPSLVVPAHAPVREWLMERMFRGAVGSLPIRVVFPGGERIGKGDAMSPLMRVPRPSVLYRRMGTCGPVGFGEGYMAGDWTSTDPAALLTPFAARITRPIRRPMAALRRWADHHRPVGERNTIDGSRENIHRHYDLSNELFALFLDESMTYSSALFAPGDDLYAAQLRKIDTVLDDAKVGAGTRVLDIGSGWGALAIRAAQRGAEVTALTISREQLSLAQRRIEAAGVGDRVRLQPRDYRDADGEYDAVVAVEMVEAVGKEYWPAYFATLERVLAPGGRIALQVITMPHDRLLATKDVSTWIQKYIFPGGQTMSLTAIEEEVKACGLRITGRRRLGGHYARTLHQWRDRFLANTEAVSALGFDATFLRMWEFYLAYCEAGFRSGYLDVWQFRLAR
ncbi:cyclopropane-fatty-acyl-phospholipid synthase family protein [Phytomonospora sp. NPDC050363]|uniref:cyclopropane-fatty-acyl-phospholipid synthase family protein n=1 Tax=Phytomonospora sp. NPDC050363 TaxID=3155642 RepID=UPI00340E19D6